MAWERSFEARVLRVREKELKYQRMNYVIEVSSWAVFTPLRTPHSSLLPALLTPLRTLHLLIRTLHLLIRNAISTR